MADKGIAEKLEYHKGWKISDDILFEESITDTVIKKMADSREQYIINQMMRLHIDPDVLLHQQQEIERLKAELEESHKVIENQFKTIARKSDEIEGLLKENQRLYNNQTELQYFVSTASVPLIHSDEQLNEAKKQSIRYLFECAKEEIEPYIHWVKQGHLFPPYDVELRGYLILVKPKKGDAEK